MQSVINRLLSCPCEVVSVSGALRWVAAKKVRKPPSEKYNPTQWHTGGRSGRLVDVFEADGCPTVRVVIQVTLVRARAARAECHF